MVMIAALTLAIPEGIIDPRFGLVGLHLIQDAMFRFLFLIGQRVGGFDSKIATAPASHEVGPASLLFLFQSDPPLADSPPDHLPPAASGAADSC